MKTKTEISNDVMEQLWKFMGDLYGPSFTSQYAHKIIEWKRHFERLGLTPGHLELGMRKCEALGETHAPNMSTFSGRCKPDYKDLGLPDEDMAYDMVVNKRWHHAIVYHAWKKFTSWDFYRWPESRSRKEFVKEYRRLVDLWIAGERFVIPRTDAPALPPREINTDIVEEERKKIQALMDKNRRARRNF